ncbi:MAG: hypothetical protein ACFFHD_16525 [Promethearchaeota archaeon]
MSANQEIPKGTLAVGIFLILLLFVQVIVELIFLTQYEEGMAPYYWAIGGISAILGLIILLNVYRKYKSGAYASKPVPEKTVTLDISDKKLFRAHLYIAIFLVIISSVILGLANSPFADPYTRGAQIAAGAILFIAAILNFVIYGTKPEKLKQRYLENRAKKAAK